MPRTRAGPPACCANRAGGPLEVLARYRARRRTRIILLNAGVASVCLVSCLVTALAHRVAWVTVVTTGLVSSFSAGVAALAIRMRRSAAAAAEALSQDEGVRDLAPLVYAMFFLDAVSACALRGRLTHTLDACARAGTTDFDEGAVNDVADHLRIAARAGHPDFDPGFAVASLAFLGRFGNQQTLACAAKIAATEPTSPQEERVRDAARACLAELRERLAQQDPRKRLLRPSAVAGRLGDLLRPSAQAVTAPHELPRPSSCGPRPASAAEAPPDRGHEVENRGGK